MQRILIKKCFLFTVGSVCHVRQFATGWETFHWWRRGWNRGMEVAETTIKRLLCCRFWRTDKVMGQMYQCWWRICQDINVFSRFKYHMFYILYPLVTSLLTLPHGITKLDILYIETEISLLASLHMAVYGTRNTLVPLCHNFFEQRTMHVFECCFTDTNCA
jgi:cellulose synthase/poly-beta-1,6-N-acetylglucosamine synthase-like glycosyltransferase